MSPWVLIVYITSAATGTTMQTQEFTSQEACESVRAQIKSKQDMDLMSAYAKGVPLQTRYKASCVPK